MQPCPSIVPPWFLRNSLQRDALTKADPARRFRSGRHPAMIRRRRYSAEGLLPESCALAAQRVEIFRIEPALERRLAVQPLAVEHREPGGVAVAALDDLVLAERALVDGAVPQR